MLRELHGSLVFGRRIRILAGQLAELLPRNASVLDVGCGDGSIDALILQQRPDLEIVGVDVLRRPHTHIPVELFNGSTLPFEDRSFDTVMFVDVLHHTDDPSRLLREAARVSRHSVVLKDHLRDGLLAGPTLRFMDWVGNAPHGVVLPYNYWPLQRWRAAFETLALKTVAWRDRLNLYPWPASMLFDRGLHFAARLELSSAGASVTTRNPAASSAS
ncbi:MAG: methylase involved in ubiquinone/menaquinone biosynthesis [Rhodospirillales bacterium]|jgi:SAM-dependent methyltransferase|nr:methylase involved in ubiquinone/menaquinone biosynthesis [Rhodospirillales bacterium]